MAEPKLGVSADGEPMHYTVGAVIEKDGKYLVIDRALPPFGWAGVAGHLGDGEDFDNAIVRKVDEEVHLEVTDKKILFREEIPWNTCRGGVDCHLWYLYSCETRGKVAALLEGAKSYDWLSTEEMIKRELEPVWEYWFKKLKIIK